MIAYIAGKITGDPDYVYKFADAQMVLEYMGYTVLNPATLPLGLEYEQYMNIDMEMLNAADTLCLLPDWKESNGAKREKRMAVVRKKRIVYYEKIRLWEVP